VLLPAPEAPTTNTNSPSFILKEISDSARVPFLYILLTLENSIIARQQQKPQLKSKPHS
jgi:hypothetical protein